MTPSMPKSTRLYVVQPLGLGTIETESLTSYVRRLAAAHVVSPSVLLRLEVLEPYRRSAGQRHQVIAPVLCTESINGARRSTTLLVDVGRHAYDPSARQRYDPPAPTRCRRFAL